MNCFNTEILSSLKENIKNIPLFRQSTDKQSCPNVQN